MPLKRFKAVLKKKQIFKFVSIILTPMMSFRRKTTLSSWSQTLYRNQTNWVELSRQSSSSNQTSETSALKRLKAMFPMTNVESRYVFRDTRKLTNSQKSCFNKNWIDIERHRLADALSKKCNQFEQERKKALELSEHLISEKKKSQELRCQINGMKRPQNHSAKQTGIENVGFSLRSKIQVPLSNYLMGFSSRLSSCKWS